MKKSISQLTKNLFPSVLTALCWLAASQSAQAKQWQFFNKHTDVTFKLNLIGGLQPQGEFTKFSGVVNYDAAKPNDSKVNVKVATESLKIDLPDSFQRLADGDFFKTKKYPYMTLVSQRVRFYRPNRAKVIGKLSFMGRTQPVVVDAEIKPMKQGKVLYLDAKTTIKRSDFGVKLPVPGVGNQIPINMKGYLIPKK